MGLYATEAARKSAAKARPAVKALAAKLNVKITENFSGGHFEILLTAPDGHNFGDVHELVSANAGPTVDGLWESALVDLRDHEVQPCDIENCEWCRQQAAADYDIDNHGSVVLVRPLNDVAKNWLLEHTAGTDAQWFSGALAVEPRYLFDLLDGMSDDGLIRKTA